MKYISKAVVSAFLAFFAMSASSQGSAPVPNAKKLVQPNFVHPLRLAHPAAGSSRLAASAQDSALVSGPREIVLYNFASPPHGAYPDWGVIRDSDGNLYGTTNGSYSDVGVEGHITRAWCTSGSDRP